MSHHSLNLTSALEAHRQQDAEACLEEVKPILHHAPHHPVALQLKAWAMSRQGQNDKALEILADVIEKNPNLVPARAEYGSILMSSRRHAEALAHLREAFQEQPERDQAAHRYAVCLIKNHQLIEAENQLRRLLERSPNHFEARYSLAMALLHQGKWEEGFQQFQIRVWLPGVEDSELKDRFIEWEGEPLAGKTLLIQCERGQGDQILFIRYARWVRETFQPDRVIVLTQPAMIPLLEAVPGVDQAVASLENLSVDRFVRLLDLPFHHRTMPDTIPYHEEAYIHLPEELTEKWRSLFHGNRKKIALCWRNPANQNQPMCDEPGQSLRPLHLEYIIDRLTALHPDAEIFSAQPGLTKKEKALLGRRKIKDISQHQIKDLADTAAILQQMDLVVSTDTPAAHLAAALSRPVWMLLPHDADWRWSVDEDQSAWYPDMRLIRQKKENDWLSLEI